jgi:hypothetical protein
MRTYATAMREMESKHVIARPVEHDLYKSDRAAIDAMRERFARELWIDRMREAIK